MNKPRFLLILTSLLLLQAPAFSQGNLIPPGAPAATMKTLEQIEPRKEINATNTPGDGASIFKITASGSYYLSGNVTGASGRSGILVTADDVSIDLNGFALLGVAGSSRGIAAIGVTRNLRVHNGAIRGWGFSGLEVTGIRNGVYDALAVADNGAAGVAVGPGSVVSRCTSVGNAGAGFSASQISGGESGKVTAFDSCNASNNATFGFAGAGSFQNCVAAYNTTGFSIQFSRVQECVATNNDTGLIASGFNAVWNSSFTSNPIAGVRSLSGTRNEIRDNFVVGNGLGVDIGSLENVVAGNTVRGNADNYNIVAGNQVEILLCQIPETIELPATVRLAGTLTGVSGSGGITVTSDNVTIDLAGHALVGVPGSLNGIFVNGNHTQISVRNGTLRNWGTDGFNGNTATRGALSDLDVFDNTGVGVQAGNQMVISRVRSHSNGGSGITALADARVTECLATVNGGNGISVGDNSIVERCLVRENVDNGITVSDFTVVTGNSCDLHNDIGRAGILVSADRNRIEGNHLTRNTVGLSLPAAANFNVVIRNTASGSTGGNNYSIVGASNDVGPIGTAAAAGTSPWANLQN